MIKSMYLRVRGGLQSNAYSVYATYTKQKKESKNCKKSYNACNAYILWFALQLRVHPVGVFVLILTLYETAHGIN